VGEFRITYVALATFMPALIALVVFLIRLDRTTQRTEVRLMMIEKRLDMIEEDVRSR
jgi:uncharacterized protein YoxC